MGAERSGDEVGVVPMVRLSTRSGRVEVIAEDRPDVRVEKGGRVVARDGDGEAVTVMSRTSAITARVPVGSRVVVGSVSGRVALSGRLGRVAVTTVSGRVTVESASRVELRSVSGRVSVEECHGEARVDSVSARVTVDRADSLWVSTKTGRVTAGAVTGSVRARTVTGRITIGIDGAPVDARLESVNGRIELSLPAGVSPRQRFASRHGSIRSEVPEGDDGEVAARTASGAIRVRVG